MRSPKYYLLFLCLFTLTVCKAQDKKFDISTPVGLDPVGVNKVLCMKNGNTVLFHFEPGKGIMVKVFDSAHKRVANTEHSCTLLDITMLRLFSFKGLYDIGGEAVLFIEQPNGGRHSLVRLRFDAATGKMIEEATMAKSKGMAKPTRYFVMKNKHDEGYAILYSSDEQQFKRCELHVTYYDGHHASYKEVPLPFDRKKYDYLDVVGAEALPDGVCVTLGLTTLLVNGTGTRLENASIYDHHLAIFFIGRNSTQPVSKLVDVSSDMYPHYTISSYNAFARSVNMVMLSYRDVVVQYGLELRPTAFMSNLFFKLDEEDLATKYTWMTNKLASTSLRTKTDTGYVYQGLPVKLFTNDNGLSTMVSQSFNRYKNVESKARADVYESFFGDIAITRFDDDGKELWGTVLSCSQYFKSYRRYYTAAEMAKRWQQQEMFGDLPPQVYGRQFASLNTYSLGSDLYIIYNDYNKNLHTEPEEPGDTVYTFNNTNTCYYKVNRKNEITKQYMFGDPMAKEYKTSFIEGADLDEQRGTYATLIQYKRGEYVSLRMAWCHLD